MTTNREWLYGLDVADLSEWFDAEHVDADATGGKRTGGDGKKPYWVEDGLLIHRNATVYVCDAEDAQAGGYDVHLCVGADDSFDHVYFDSDETLCNRSTLREAWTDAADWLGETANTLTELRSYILENETEMTDDQE